MKKIYHNRDLFFDTHKLFHKVFNANFLNYMDEELTTSLQKPILDIQRFDHLLHELYGDYENKKLSMYDVLVKNYSETVVLQIKGLLA